MTSPGPDDSTRRLAAAATATDNRPGLAVALAQSDLSESEIQGVGGFVEALQLSVARRLADQSGAKLNLSVEERNKLAGIGEIVAEEESEDDSRSWFEKATDWAAGALSNTGSALIHNPVTDGVLTGFEWLGNAAKMPFRVLSDQVDYQNDDEMKAAMAAEGYDPTSTTSYLAFMFEQGDSQYHDLSRVRDVFGDENVDLAIQMHADAEQFQRDFEKMAPEEAAALQQRMESAEFQDAFDAVDRRHISPGRDLARLLLPQGEGDKSGFLTEDGAAFTALSGTLDAAYLWFTDPILILGRAAHTLRAVDALGRGASLPERFLSGIRYTANKRAGLQSMTDQAGVEALLRTEGGRAVTKVGKGWQRFLDDAADLRAADAAGDEARRAGIYAVMDKRYGALMGMLPEINGARVIEDAVGIGGRRNLGNFTTTHLTTKGKPIEDLDELADYMVSTNGLLRLHNGMAARETIVMPGRLSWRAERTAAADAKTLFTRRNKAKKTSRWIDYSKPNELLPNEAERQLLDEAMEPEAVRAGLAQNNLMLKTSLLHARAARAKFERVARRFQTQIPKVERLDLGDPGAAKTVEQLGRMYLNRGDAAKLASAYALATDINAKRAIVRGMLVQSFHASGLSRSEAGRNFMERFIGDQAALTKQQYGYAKTSEILTDRGAVQAALYPDQISRTVILPSMREMHYLATKFAVGGFAGRTGLAHVRGMAQGDGMDALIGVIKLGWITSAAGGLRNAIDEIANFAAYGMSKDVLAGRVAFTQATKGLRAERRAASKTRRAMIATLGRAEADDRIASQLGQGLKSHEDATLMVERARKAEEAVARVPERLKQRVNNAHVARAEVYTNRYRALGEFEDAKKAKLPEEQLAPLRARATYWSDEVAKAEQAVKLHEKIAKDPGGVVEKVKASFDRKGVLSVADAEAELKAAKAELTRAQNLQTAISHRIPYWARLTADTVNDVLVGAVLGKAMSVFGKDWAITGDRVKWANELVDREMNITFRDGIFQAHHADTQLVNASDDAAMDYHRAGLMARKYSFRSNGWGEIEADGGAGLTAWAKTLQLRFADSNSPAHSWVQTVHAMHRPGDPRLLQEARAEHARVRAENERKQREFEQDYPSNVPAENAAPRPAELPSDWVQRLAAGEYQGVPEELRQELAGMLRQAEGLRADFPNPADWPTVAPELHQWNQLDMTTRKAAREALEYEVSHGRSIRYFDDEGDWVEIHSVKAFDDLLDSPSEAGGPFDHLDIPGRWRLTPIDDSGPAPDLLRADRERELQAASEQMWTADEALAAAEDINKPMTRAEWEHALGAARESVLRRLDDEDMRHFVESAEVFQWYKGEKIAKGDTEILKLAKEEYADRVSADLAQALGREGTINKPLLDELAAGRVPDRSWLAQLPKDERPSHAIGQLWAPYNPAMQPGQITRGMTGMMVKAYDKVVTDQINALSRNPLVTALYMRARENTKGYVDHLVANGWDPQIADDMGRRIAAQHAEVEALKHIDNPYVSSQFSMIARNQWAFVRAQEDWLRRWGRTIKDNPELIRKAQLLIHGGESVGFLEQDDQGELHFVYPGSNLMLGIFGDFFGAVGQENGARVPVAGELSSQLTFLNPSLDNPLGFSGTPLISLPWKAISHFMGPDNVLMTSSIDKVINGELGAGREWYEQLLPSWVNRIMGSIPTEDMGSRYGAAIQSTAANLEAAGMLTDPKYQTPEGKAELLHALQVGTQNDLIATALFGFFLPAAPTYQGVATETAEGFDGMEADWSAHIEGLRSLKDEARQVYARLPYEEAKAWWMAVHPNELILAPTGAGSRTSVGADNASAPATIAAAKYLEENHEFFMGENAYGGKGGVAAYFIPQGPAGTTNGTFSDVAYRAQLELGIRDHKSLDEYFTDIVTARGYQQYFDAKDEIDARRAAAAGSRSLTDQLDAEWDETRKRLMAGNPLLDARLRESAVENASNSTTMQSLYRLVDDTRPAVTKALGPNRDAVMALLSAKEQRDEALASLGDRRGSAANRRREQIKTNYESQIEVVSAQYPGVADLARGLFRPTS